MLIFLLVIWVGLYLLVTKNEKIKYRIKLYLRRTFADQNDFLWVKIVSGFYILFPFSMLFFLNTSHLLPYLYVNNYVFILTIGVTGFVATLSISALLLDLGTAIKNISYEEMNQVKWMKQVMKLHPLISVGAAISEEFFQRLLIPIVVYKTTQNGVYLIVSLIFTSCIFTFLQVVYADTVIQKMVKLTAGVSLSTVSISLFLITMNIIPSIIMHGLYVMFFVKREKKDGGKM